jgi:hypothetical protein
MKRYLITCILALASALTAHALEITYLGGVTNTADSSGPAWVSGTNMFRNIQLNATGAWGDSGATAATQTGI